MSWLQAKIATTEENASQIEGLLEDFGALSISLEDSADDPVLEPDLGTTPLWQNTTVVALFGADTPLESLREYLLQHRVNGGDIHLEILEDRDWEREWMTHFRPTRFGERLWICPSWQPPPDPDAVNLLLDPGLAFGTGTHPTTGLCLRWLDQQQLQGKNVIDFGCGSGILAIAALLLGANEALGIDIDPQALDASVENASRNQVREKLQVALPDQYSATPAEVVLANILANPLIELSATLGKLTRTGGRIALSGILKEQEAAVRDAYMQDFELEASQYQEDWVLISGTRR